MLPWRHGRPWLAAMRLEVAARKSCFLWRRTDDVHYRCALHRGKSERQRFWRGHYELVVCTEETSAAAPRSALAVGEGTHTGTRGGCRIVRAWLRTGLPAA